MNNEQMLQQLGKTAVTKSINDLVNASGIDAGPVTLVMDCSGSMGNVMGNGKRRIDGLRDAVSQIQTAARDGVRMVAFDTNPSFVTEIPEPTGGTYLERALLMARTDGATRVIVISDGQPWDELSAWEEGERLGRCDCIFVGDKGGHGREFLKELAKRTGGTMFDGDLAEVKVLVAHVLGLLGDGSTPKPAAKKRGAK